MYVQAIPDSVAPGLRLLFIGYNPSLVSGETGHNYANKSNRFWKLLRDAGLTDRLYAPEEDRSLIAQGIGFTNIVSRPTRRADEITREEYAEGRVKLRALIEQNTPAICCFVGKGVYEQYSGRRNPPWGVQETQVVPGVTDFVAPSSSGLVRMPYAEILSYYQQLKTLSKSRED